MGSSASVKRGRGVENVPSVLYGMKGDVGEADGAEQMSKNRKLPEVRYSWLKSNKSKLPPNPVHVQRRLEYQALSVKTSDYGMKLKTIHRPTDKARAKVSSSSVEMSQIATCAAGYDMTRMSPSSTRTAGTAKSSTNSERPQAITRRTVTAKTRMTTAATRTGKSVIYTEAFQDGMMPKVNTRGRTTSTEMPAEPEEYYRATREEQISGGKEQAECIKNIRKNKQSLDPKNVNKSKDRKTIQVDLGAEKAALQFTEIPIVDFEDAESLASTDFDDLKHVDTVSTDESWAEAAMTVTVVESPTMQAVIPPSESRTVSTSSAVVKPHTSVVISIRPSNELQSLEGGEAKAGNGGDGSKTSRNIAQGSFHDQRNVITIGGVSSKFCVDGMPGIEESPTGFGRRYAGRSTSPPTDKSFLPPIKSNVSTAPGNSATAAAGLDRVGTLPMDVDNSNNSSHVMQGPEVEESLTEIQQLVAASALEGRFYAPDVYQVNDFGPDFASDSGRSTNALKKPPPPMCTDVFHAKSSSSSEEDDVSVIGFMSFASPLRRAGCRGRIRVDREAFQSRAMEHPSAKTASGCRGGSPLSSRFSLSTPPIGLSPNKAKTYVDLDYAMSRLYSCKRFAVGTNSRPEIVKKDRVASGKPDVGTESRNEEDLEKREFSEEDPAGDAKKIKEYQRTLWYDHGGGTSAAQGDLVVVNRNMYLCFPIYHNRQF